MIRFLNLERDAFHSKRFVQPQHLSPSITSCRVRSLLPPSSTTIFPNPAGIYNIRYINTNSFSLVALTLMYRQLVCQSFCGNARNSYSLECQWNAMRCVLPKISLFTVSKGVFTNFFDELYEYNVKLLPDNRIQSRSFYEFYFQIRKISLFIHFLATEPVILLWFNAIVLSEGFVLCSFSTGFTDSSGQALVKGRF